MKKIYIAVVAASLVMFGVSCERKAEVVPANKVKNTASVSERTGGATMVWVLAFSTCAGEPKDCGTGGTIVGKAAKLSGLQIAVNNGPTAIGTFFSNTDNWDVFPDNYPSTAQMESLASGNYNIIIMQNSGSADTYYFLCGPAGTLTTDNPEFVVQATYEN